ncbi:MAG: ATP-binding cassette domain-containing protein [Acidimicrobiia bacterium]|nr:ATP-binding cassette domain-containing protein [Acidimicrobiia bacterium]
MDQTSSPGCEPVLRAEGLRRSFGDRVAVDDVSLSVSAGETYGLLGPNGAGKSTTIALLTGLLEPDAGSVTVAGVPIRPGSVQGKGAIGLVPQEVAVYPDLSAEENLDFFARLQGLGKSERTARIDEVLAVTGLGERRRERTVKFSGGMRRRLNIGIGLLHRPALLVLDEPTVGVDPQSRNAILESVEALSGEGLAVLYTTHYMEEAERLCDRVGIIDEGRLLVEGTTAELTAMLGEQERVEIGVRGRAEAVLDRLRADEGVAEATLDDATLRVLVDDASRRLGSILDALTGAGVEVNSVEVDRPDLEAVFLHLTGKGLRQ